MTNLFDDAEMLTTEPTKIVAGDIVTWRVPALSEYADGNFTLTYFFRPSAGGDGFSIPATVVNDEFHVTVEPSVTGTLKVAEWSWQAVVTRLSDDARRVARKGAMTVEPGLDNFTADSRSQAVRTLDKINALIEGRADADVTNYTIGGRQINKMTVDDLMKWKSYFEQRVEREKNVEAINSGQRIKNSLKVRFV